MAKFVCDYDVVSSVGQELIDTGNEMNSATTTFSSHLDSDLSGWNGSAKDGFLSEKTTQVNDSSERAKYLVSFGEFIKGASQSIQELDESLSNLSI